ncbi:hypothetical protein [Halospeciosus flavus]|uniref:DUF8056 domain-containing protein n=1 Tax=Halospeciosus flavus TaxID=3032283 RepID=A0ABD5Z8I8_9EURY|nr:hypothetical protein [Halospeciosus flavus]
MDTRESESTDGDRERGEESTESRSYSGVLTAVPYAVRVSDSWLFRLYAVVGAFLALVVTIGFGLSLLKLLVETAALPGGLVTLSRTFFVLVGLAVVLPLLAPILLVARRHRRNQRVSRFYDALLALTGFGFVVGVYLALVVSAPPEYRAPATNPVIDALYALPPLVGLVPIVVAAALIGLVHLWGSRPGRRDAE